MKLEIWQIFDKYSDMKFHINPSSGSRFVPCGWTERQRGWQTDTAKLIVAFRNFAKASKNWQSKFLIENYRCEGKSVTFYYYYYYYLVQLICPSVAIVLTLVQTTHIRIIYSYIKETIQKHSTNISEHIKYTYYQTTHTTVKTPPHTLTHTLQNE
jgi:hypothetical protein